jgi:ABC-2 type transport system permease protein
MRALRGFSSSRWLGVLIKEFIQLKRDRLTFGMIMGIPIMLLMLFGFAINTDPKHLPTAVVMSDPGPFARAYVSAMDNSTYFKIVGQVNEHEANTLLNQGRVQFVITFPPGFHRQVVRGEPATVLVEADATDPMATGGAIAVLNQISPTIFAHEISGGLNAQAPVLDLVIHRRFNPEAETSYNIVPGLLGVILTMTMVLMTGLAVTRERERGTLENLLSTPATPAEVITGKIIPYILIGLVQVTLILLVARFVFHVPLLGNVVLLYGVVLLFILANLTIGITFSAIARNQLQAMQLTYFYFLPSMLLSGFMFPFRGMPEWAQWVGNLLPLTHFLVLVRGIVLKANTLGDLWPHIWPLLVFTATVLGLGVKSFKHTLD